MIETTILLSSVASAVYGIIGYIKAQRQKNEEFDFPKYAKTIALGIIIGIVYGLLGLPLNEDAIMSILAFMGLNSGIETLSKSI